MQLRSKAVRQEVVRIHITRTVADVNERFHINPRGARGPKILVAFKRSGSCPGEVLNMFCEDFGGSFKVLEGFRCIGMVRKFYLA